jgi:hypothetical protein
MSVIDPEFERKVVNALERPEIRRKVVEIVLNDALRDTRTQREITDIVNRRLGEEMRRIGRG